MLARQRENVYYSYIPAFKHRFPRIMSANPIHHFRNPFIPHQGSISGRVSRTDYKAIFRDCSPERDKLRDVFPYKLIGRAYPPFHSVRLACCQTRKSNIGWTKERSPRAKRRTGERTPSGCMQQLLCVYLQDPEKLCGSQFRDRDSPPTG